MILNGLLSANSIKDGELNDRKGGRVVVNVIEIFRCGECMEVWYSYSRAEECCREDGDLEEEDE